MSQLESYKAEFIRLALDTGALWVSPSDDKDRELKSGRMSPYLFNAGAFKTCAGLTELGRAYAGGFMELMPRCGALLPECLYGPPYKGILIVSAMAAVLHIEHQHSLGLAFSRREAKGYGEDGVMMGTSLDGLNTIIVDDVITDGGTKWEAVNLIREKGGVPAGLLIAFDRQERGLDNSMHSAMQRFQDEFDIPVQAVATLTDLTVYMEETGHMADRLPAIRRYQEAYGADV